MLGLKNKQMLSVKLWREEHPKQKEQKCCVPQGEKKRGSFKEAKIKETKEP